MQKIFFDRYVQKLHKKPLADFTMNLLFFVPFRILLSEGELQYKAAGGALQVPPQPLTPELAPNSCNCCSCGKKFVGLEGHEI